jgi:Polyketide cyclase / dehydrase and lipid transport
VSGRRRRSQIAADGLVPLGREAVFAFLAELENHWRLAGGWIEVQSLDQNGGSVRMRGPLGVKRTARTRVEATDPPRSLEGSANLGRTQARVRWALTEDGPHTQVHLEATVVKATPLDHLLLTLGGRRWLHRQFTKTIQQLALATSDQGLGPIP